MSEQTTSQATLVAPLEDVFEIVERGELNGKGEISKDILAKLKQLSPSQLSAQNADGLRPIHVAVKADNLAYVKVLLDCGASVHGYDKNGYSSLHHAAESGQVSMAALLIQRGATVDAVEHNQKTPLHLASEKGRLEVAKLLLIRGAWVLSGANESLQPIHYAAANGHVHVVRLLLKHFADINARDSSGSNVLHMTSHRAHVDCIDLFMHYGVDVNSRGRLQRTSMQMAAMAGCVESIHALLKWGADFHIQDPRGLTPLNALATRDYANAARLLLDADADVNTMENRLRTPLHRAVEKQHIEVVKVLLDSGVDIDALDSSGTSAVHTACSSGNESIYRLLYDRGVDLTKFDQSGRCLLHFAARGNAASILRELAEDGTLQFELSTTQVEQTPLFEACKYGSTAALSYLLSIGAVSLGTAEVMLLLDVAARYGRHESIECLRNHGIVADINLSFPQTGSHILHLAVMGPSPQQAVRTVELVNRLTQALAHLIKLPEINVLAVDGRGKTAVHLACELGYEAAFITLMDHIRLLPGQTVDIREQSASGYTCLHIAAAAGHLDIAEALIKDYHANVHITCNSIGYTPLHMAADNGHENVAHQLLLRGADINAPSTGRHSTPLHVATGRKNISFVTFLLSRGADVNRANKVGIKPLHMASTFEERAIQDLLIQHHALVDLPDHQLNTALHYAAKYGVPDAITLLLQNGAHRNRLNAEGKRPYDVAKNEACRDTLSV